jgi:ribonuclease G
MELTIAGRYMVYAPTARASASRAGSTTPSATACARRPSLDLRGGGAIIRTAAHGAKRADFERELQYLFKLNEVLSSACESRRRPRWSSRRPTSRCASCATSSPTLRARDRRRRKQHHRLTSFLERTGA